MKKISAAIASTVAFLSFASPTLAQIDPCPGGQYQGLCADPSSFGGILGSVLVFIFVIAIVLALLFLIYGGIKWLVSGGDKGKVEEARGTIIAAVIGLIIIFLSYFILNFVLSFFGLSFQELRLPRILNAPTGQAANFCSPGSDPTALNNGCVCENGEDAQGFCQ